jgi:GNAT superfamily N-acetyltransferase
MTGFAAFSARTTPRGPCPAVVGVGTRADARPAARLAVGLAGRSEDDWTERLERDADGADRDFLVARLAGEVVGYTRVGLVAEADPSGWWLVGLVVATFARRQGVGEALLTGAAAHVARRADVLTSSYDRANRASAELHRRVGFAVVRDGDSRFPGYPAVNAQVTVQLDLAGRLS